MGAMPQNQLTSTVRHACIDEDVVRLPEMIHAWRCASARMVRLAETEKGTCDQITVQDVPEEIHGRIAEISTDPLFQASFSAMPTSFK